MPNNNKISIISVNFNGLKDTCEMIDSIPSPEGIEIIIVDNGSNNDEASIISLRYPFVKTIRSEQNLGFAGGNNLGIRVATGDYLFFLNNDTILKEDWNINALVQRLSSDEHIGMVCPKIRFSWGNCPIQFAGYTPLSPITLRNKSIGYNEEERMQYNTARPTPYAHGAAMLVSRKALDKVGLMPECFFLYYEELDWSLMFRRAGYDIWYEPNCTIYHKESQATGQNSPLKNYYITRNRLLFAKRNISTFLCYLTYIYLIGIVGLRNILKETLLRHNDQRQAVIQGICDFIKGEIGSKKGERD